MKSYFLRNPDRLSYIRQMENDNCSFIGLDHHERNESWTFIEWMKINPVHIKREHRGALLDDKIQVDSFEAELVSILKKYNIPYEYAEGEKVYIIYGYK